MARRMICCFCRKRIYKQRNGEWYHEHNGSVSCRPGDGDHERRATPSVIQSDDAQ